jgi:hypothetical protein
MTSKDLMKNLTKKIGADVIMQSLIELIDDSIDATDYDIDSVRNPNDIWKFKVIEHLEQAYEVFIKHNNQTIIGDQS